MYTPTQSEWTMDQKEFEIALYGRRVFFQCKACKRVNAPAHSADTLSVWEEAAVALNRHKVTSEHPWWFHTLCNVCQLR